MEISILNTIFETLKLLITAGWGFSTVLGQLSNADGPVEQCKQGISELERLLGEGKGAKQGRGKKNYLSLTRLAWPLKEDKARQLLKNIREYRKTIALILTTESM